MHPSSVARHFLTALVSSSALVGFVGCGGNGNKMVDPLGTGGTITIQITRSTRPDFSWQSGTTAPAAQAISVSNFNPAGAVDRILWGYRNISVSPPVTYGTTIAGGLKLGVGDPPPLQSGVRYRVEIVVDGKASWADWLVP